MSNIFYILSTGPGGFFAAYVAAGIAELAIVIASAAAIATLGRDGFFEIVYFEKIGALDLVSALSELLEEQF